MNFKSDMYFTFFACIYVSFFIGYAIELKGKIFLLQENVPVITVMCNKGLRSRHWKQMTDIIGFDITPNTGSTLRKMLKLNIAPVMTQFEGISVAASKVVIDLIKCYLVFNNLAVCENIELQ